ncbi:MBL fold metallo-hydrolase [Planctomycetes bacterium TBK1r]|uniref:Metallo-hydrolase n=1 Tax=Stieleria magnilauensis TaxID=2527963 RepID=A0ABX5XW62_9BACT|nr:putative metallo-hydrolase [Planctomycetes bacterium TBK1r]
MLLYQRFVPGLAIASYVVGDERSGQAVVVDPTRDVDDYIRYAKDNDLHIRHVLETHVHADYVCGSSELKARLGKDVEIHCSGAGDDEWTPPYADHVVSDGDEVAVGSVRLKAMHTPGHTPEHTSWALYDDSRSRDTPWLIFTGDFLFVGDVGRPDLLGKEAQQQLAHQLYQSVFERLSGWPDITEIFPGHGAGSLCGKAISSRRSSTVGYERRFNASLKEKPEAGWVADLLGDMPLTPPYFRRMKQVNSKGPKAIGNLQSGEQRWNAKSVHERVCDNCLIVDVRSKEAFSAAHIPGSINIPFGPTLPTWAGWVLPYDRPTLLVLDEPGRLQEVNTHLLRVGFDDVRGYLEGGIDAWETSGFELTTLKTQSVHELQKSISHSQDAITVLDVRTEKEWNSGHIDRALHIHGGTLQDRYSEISRDKPVAVICGSGYRGSIAASFLQREGYERVSNVMGGMSAWKAAELPTEKNNS